MEIERKFLTQNDEWRKEIRESILMKQGYISTNPNHCIRIRITNKKAYLTIKGKGSHISRPEYEYEIPTKDAEEMYCTFCQEANLEKIRHIVYFQNHKWEIDEFQGRHQGLIVAEVELKSEDEEVLIPNWIGKEVTGDSHYYNSNLVKAK